MMKYQYYCYNYSKLPRTVILKIDCTLNLNKPKNSSGYYHGCILALTILLRILEKHYFVLGGAFPNFKSF